MLKICYKLIKNDIKYNFKEKINKINKKNIDSINNINS